MVRIAVTTPCVRCLKPTQALFTEVLAWGDLRYEVRVCQRHHMMLEQEVRAWTNLGTLVDDAAPAPVVRPTPDELQTRRPAYTTPPTRGERLHVPVVRVVEEIDDDLEPWRDELPAEARALAGIPELADWRLTRKAREQAGHAGIDVLAVMMTAALPDSTEPSANAADDDVRIHVRGTIRALVSPSTRTVITVFRRAERSAEPRRLARTS